ncbi:MAG: fumarate hydratase C-terminal domain-containing protein, partial [Atribacterota bacterium]
LLEKYSSIYGIACGGAAAYISQFVTRCQVLAYPELGTQALLRLFVQDFPLVVAYDAHGGDLFESGKIRYRRITLY